VRLTLPRLLPPPPILLPSSSPPPSQATFEKGLEGSFSEAKDYLQLWTAYCDYLRRRVGPTDTMDTSSLVELRKTFKRARDNLDACTLPSCAKCTLGRLYVALMWLMYTRTPVRCPSCGKCMLGCLYVALMW